MEKGILTIDGISSEYLIEHKKTKTIKYKVYPDFTIKVIVPEKMSLEEIQVRVNKRRTWIRKQIEFYTQNKTSKTFEYKSGSTIKYLGKQYRLKIVETEKNSIKLVGRFLEVRVKDRDSKKVEKMIGEWYRYHAVHYFNRMIEKCLIKVGKYGVNPPILTVRKMKSRWGSCIQNKNKIIINTDLIKEPSQCIEYVLMHELCHLKYPSHNNQFYTFFSIVMPDWRLRKRKLEKLLL